MDYISKEMSDVCESKDTSKVNHKTAALLCDWLSDNYETVWQATMEDKKPNKVKPQNNIRDRRNRRKKRCAMFCESKETQEGGQSHGSHSGSNRRTLDVPLTVLPVEISFFPLSPDVRVGPGRSGVTCRRKNGSTG